MNLEETPAQFWPQAPMQPDGDAGAGVEAQATLATRQQQPARRPRMVRVLPAEQGKQAFEQLRHRPAVCYS